ncbi:MAG: hypothetical protein ACLFPQ_02990 [Candidatus Woesearchaeota archaeon]
MIIGSEKDLVDRINSSQSTLLVRAINDQEVDQLLEDGSDSFRFNKGTEYETKYGDMVRMYAERRNGTVIIYQLQDKDVAPYDKNRKFEVGGWVHCVKTFSAPVEVYNVDGLNLKELKDLRKKGSYFDKILRNYIIGLYEKNPSKMY